MNKNKDKKEEKKRRDPEVARSASIEQGSGGKYGDCVKLSNIQARASCSLLIWRYLWYRNGGFLISSSMQPISCQSQGGGRHPGGNPVVVKDKLPGCQWQEWL